jgi:hypothetical protein
MSVYRIYADESGTHSHEWLVIGMLFVPDHGPLQSDLCKVKENWFLLRKVDFFLSEYPAVLCDAEPLFSL